MATMKPVCKISPEGTKQWLVNNKLHREDGPAIECGDGRKYWYINGKRHRIDGPAVEFVNGNKQYYLNGKCYSFEEWDRLRKLPWLL